MKNNEESEQTTVEEQKTENYSNILGREELDDEPVKVADDRTGSSYLPGVIQVQLHDWLRPEATYFAESNTYGLKRSDLNRPLRHINQILDLNKVQKIERTFQMITRTQADQYQEVARQQGMTVPNLCSFFTLYFPEEVDVKKLAQAIDKLPIVVSAIPVARTIPPHDNHKEPLLGDSDVAQTLGTGIQTQWYIFRCGINDAWKHAPKGGKGVVIADIDWGYLTTHADLKDRLDPDHRYNASDDSTSVSQGGEIDHGTAVMGLVGAGANGFGMVGVAFNAELWAIQVNAFPEDAVDMWLKAIQWVMMTDSGPKRKVMMLEGQTFVKSNIESVPAIRGAVQNAIAIGILVCVPAGNGTKDASVNDQGNPFPPSGSIIVGATDYSTDGTNKSKGNSNRGDSVTVWAPGDGDHDVTCSDKSDYCYRNRFGGTSGATPKVAGTVALMLEVNPYIRHSDVRDILNRTGTRVIPSGRFLNSEAAVLAAGFAPAWGTRWQPLPTGKAIDIEFGSDRDSLWHVGLDHRIYRLNGDDWIEDNALCEGAPCSALKIAMGADGSLWHISTTDEKIYRQVSGVWQQVPGQALDIASGADGSIWHVGFDNSIYRWDGNKWEPVNSPSPAIKIAVDPEGRPWYIAADTPNIFKKARNLWEQVPGRAQDIAIGDDGSVWHIGLDEPGEEGRMRRWNGCTWEPIDGTATVIAVAPNGLPFHINSSGDILART